MVLKSIVVINMVEICKILHFSDFLDVFTWNASLHWSYILKKEVVLNNDVHISPRQIVLTGRFGDILEIIRS